MNHWQKINGHLGNKNSGNLELEDYDEKAWFGESGVPDPNSNPIARAIGILSMPETMENLESLFRGRAKGIRNGGEKELKD
ncbi:unnamed protein product [Enterobius vermicularis]|uniref:Calpain catalytic domain-containing protein n=1 Tax=Enterobius vermicularis TaxID=51028 RepID=A0A0N4VLL7_ENTVE|nr:unnamed protein product [Enterobius vermicularis]